MKCPLCFGESFHYSKIETQEQKCYRNKAGIFKCLACGLLFLEDYQMPRNDLYQSEYSVWGKDLEKNEKIIAESKKQAFFYQLKKLLQFIRPENKKLLDIGTGKGYFLEEAEKVGFDVFGLDISQYACESSQKKFKGKIFQGELSDSAYPENYFDVVSATDFIEHISDPQKLLREISRIIKPKGFLFLITPDISSFSRKIWGRRWFQYKYEHVIYWEQKTLQRLLQNHDFEIVFCRSNYKRFQLGYYRFYFQKYAFFGLRKPLLFFLKILPNFIKNLSFSNPLTGELILIAKSTKKYVPDFPHNSHS